MTDHYPSLRKVRPRDENDAEDSKPAIESKKAKRSVLTQIACMRCRQKKAKCNGVRAVCGRCNKDGAECLYDVVPGLTRMQNLGQQLEIATENLDRTLVLLNAFKNSSDQDASLLLARFRCGEDIESLVSCLNDSESKTSVSPSVGLEGFFEDARAWHLQESGTKPLWTGKYSFGPDSAGTDVFLAPGLPETFDLSPMVDQKAIFSPQSRPQWRT